MSQLSTANSSVSQEHPYTSFEKLSERYSQLNELSEMNDEEKIEVFTQVLDMLNNDLNREQD
jgi:bacterioferritin (cytochrome b1)